MGLEGWLVMGGVVLILGLVALFMFRNEIAGMLNRTRSIGNGAVRIDPAQQGAVVEKDPQIEAEKLIREVHSDLIQEAEEHLTKELNKRGLSGDPALRVAIRYASANWIMLDFERIYRLIWGSQLNLLSYLNTQRQGHPREAFRLFYTPAANLYPEAYEHMSYDQWLAFLLDNLLLREDDRQLRITVKGCEFLTHLAKVGYTLDKVG